MAVLSQIINLFLLISETSPTLTTESVLNALLLILTTVCNDTCGIPDARNSQFGHGHLP